LARTPPTAHSQARVLTARTVLGWTVALCKPTRVSRPVENWLLRRTARLRDGRTLQVVQPISGAVLSNALEEVNATIQQARAAAVLGTEISTVLALETVTAMANARTLARPMGLVHVLSVGVDQTAAM
jgi:hypothetical protein